MKWSDLQTPDVNWYRVCNECHHCEVSLLSELNRVAVIGHPVELLDEQQLRTFAKLPYRTELIHTLLNEILDKPLQLVSCIQFIPKITITVCGCEYF